jgi:nickel-dependent lactate racemase
MMNNIRIPYGRGSIDVPLQKNMEVEIIDIPDSFYENEQISITKALQELDLVKISKASSIAIVVSDLSRPIPNEKILGYFCEELKKRGVSKNNICFYIASGMHKPASLKEVKQILGKYFSANFKVVIHDVNTSLLHQVGTTSRGVPVEVNDEFLRAEVKIAIGSVQPHQIAGYSGGAKSIAIGLGGEKFITANHSFLDHPACQVGNLNNPARKEIEEAGRMAGLDFLINVVLDRQGHLAYINAGTIEESYSLAVDFASRFFSVPVKGKKDLVIVSPGGYPKDLNLYQAQKALEAGSKVLKPNGCIILAACCEEEIGNDAFFEYMKEFKNPLDLIKQFKTEPFQIGPHKAYIWAKRIVQNQVILVSNLQANKTKYLMVQTENNLGSAIASLLSGFQDKVELGIMPHATTIMPDLLG